MRKFEIVETPYYLLAVSDKTPVFPEPYYVSNCLGDRIEYAETKPSGVVKKIIAHQPKGNAPKLDLPLLPEMDVEDDVEKLAKKYVDDNYPHYTNLKEKAAAIEDVIWGYKAATKVYSEEDLMKAIDLARETLEYDEQHGWYSTMSEDEIIQSLKNPKTPKWFVAEKDNYMHEDELKTETNSEGKQVLKGHYL